MKSIIAISMILILFEKVFSQEFTYQPSLKEQLLFGGIEIPVDSSIKVEKRRLQPANLSFMEKLFWDENGLFRTMGLASPLSPEVRKSELNLRRTMLTAHQIGGFVTLGCMISAVYFGQLNIDGKQG